MKRTKKVDSETPSEAEWDDATRHVISRYSALLEAFEVFFDEECAFCDLTDEYALDECAGCPLKETKWCRTQYGHLSNAYHATKDLLSILRGEKE